MWNESYATEWDDSWYGDMFAFLIRDLLRYDDDNLPSLKKEIVEWAKCIAGRADEFKDAPWCRFPRDLVYEGHWAAMSAGERRVYGALLALVDFRSLVTYATVATIADMAGFGPDRASKALTALKKRGLIRRWPSRKSGYEVWFTKLLPHAVYESPQEAGVLKERVIPAGRF